MKGKSYINTIGTGVFAPLSIVAVVMSGCGENLECDKEVKFTPDGKQVIVCDDDDRSGTHTSTFIPAGSASSAGNGLHGSTPPESQPKVAPAPKPKSGFFSSFFSGHAGGGHASSGG